MDWAWCYYLLVSLTTINHLLYLFTKRRMMSYTISHVLVIWW